MCVCGLLMNGYLYFFLWFLNKLVMDIYIYIKRERVGDRSLILSYIFKLYYINNNNRTQIVTCYKISNAEAS